ncbi:conserved hypothetical protein [Rhodopseudomonas palustris HaA2]|uniref:Uncharacterized protein n=1 Tax=Rhodopseudomonas palustris (strain HaA2) TaxID=316058 RepID=Q2J3F0_RHOP2|nr:hypothetical protein [Rhodopseudomonas palustris]ABD05010.1 conserved hypothetical protein [Rhodopseudomonas palustris HaA2]
MQSEGKSYPFDHLPAIDYDAHPAYGRVMSMPMLGARLKAISYFSYGFLLASAQRLIDIEHLPRPAEAGKTFVAVLRNLPTTLRQILLQRLARVTAGQAYAPKTERGTAVFVPLQGDGFAVTRLGADAIAQIRTQLAPQLTTLEQRATPAGDPASSRMAIDPAVAPDLYRWFNQTAADLGLTEAASAYLKRPVGVGAIVAEVVDAPAAPATSPFADVGVDTSPCDGFKVDPGTNVLKLVIYLGDVGAGNGPLTYVAGSNRAATRFWDGLIRRANDLAGLSSTLQTWRETFYALPAGLQRKAAFGADLVADSNFAAAIEANQVAVTSRDGNAVLYDPAGIHRDAALTQGRRTAVIVTFTELPR